MLHFRIRINYPFILHYSRLCDLSSLEKTRRSKRSNDSDEDESDISEGNDGAVGKRRSTRDRASTKKKRLVDMSSGEEDKDDDDTDDLSDNNDKEVFAQTFYKVLAAVISVEKADKNYNYINYKLNVESNKANAMAILEQLKKRNTNYVSIVFCYSRQNLLQRKE